MCMTNGHTSAMLREKTEEDAEGQMATGWMPEETKALIGVWGEANVQQQLDSVRRNRDIYEGIASELAKKGYAKTYKQCRCKIKNLTQRYRKASLSLYTVLVGVYVSETFLLR